MTAADRDLAQMLRQLGKPVALAVNKIDTAARETLSADFYSLGIPDLFPVSAEHRRGLEELLDQVTNYANLRPPVRATLQCIAALGPDFALKEHAYTASGDPDKWKRDRDRRPILDPDAIAEAMGIPKRDVHRYLCQARVILRQAFNADGKLFQIH